MQKLKKYNKQNLFKTFAVKEKQISWFMFNAEINSENQIIHPNFDRMYEYLGKDRECIKMILLLVIDELKVTAQMFENFLTSGKLDEINETAHKLIGTTSSVGLDRLTAVTRNIEVSSKSNPAGLRQYLRIFKNESTMAEKMIEAYLLNC